MSLYEKKFMLIHELYIKCNNQLMLEFSSRSSLTHILRRSPYCNSYTPKLKGSQNSATLFQIYQLFGGQSYDLSIIFLISDSSSCCFAASATAFFRVSFWGNIGGCQERHQQNMMKRAAHIALNSKKVLLQSWLSRIYYFENSRQNLCSHLELGFLK